MTERTCWNAKYIGSDCGLKNKTAAVRIIDGEKKVLAQFDDMGTGLGFGWWPFDEDEFEYSTPVDWSEGDGEGSTED